MSEATVRSSAGRVVAIWRYPVKSMMGEELNATLVTDRGLLGDRSLALVDAETGKVASAKTRGGGRLCSNFGPLSSNRPLTWYHPHCRRFGSRCPMAPL